MLLQRKHDVLSRPAWNLTIFMHEPMIPTHASSTSTPYMHTHPTWSPNVLEDCATMVLMFTDEMILSSNDNNQR